jgi:hypothetical protein
LSVFTGIREEHTLVFKYRVLRKTFGPRWEIVTGGWRKLFNLEVYDFYLPVIIQVIKLRQVRWVGHVACMEHSRNACCFGGES